MRRAGGLTVPNKIQPGECSTGDGIRLRYGWRGARSVSVGNVNRDERDWNANVNRLDNDNRWNADNRLLVRNTFYFLSLTAGVFFSRYERHPTSILLASVKDPLICMCCAFVIALHSHPTSKRNFATSSRAMELLSAMIFCADGRYDAEKADSSASRIAPSIRVPIVCRRAFATCGRDACQARYASFNFDTTGTKFSCGIVRGGTFRDMRAQFSHTYDNIISVDNLLGAWKEFLRGKRKKKDVQEFGYHLVENIRELHHELARETYQHDGYEHFRISDPKPRDIHKASVRDRLVHHALYRQLYPFFDHTFIADSYSCRKEKGTHRAMNRFRSFANKVSKNDTRTYWVLKCDIRKFFASIDQQILMRIIKKYTPDARTVALLTNIIGSFNSGIEGKGLPLGNLTSQLLVNIYMNEFDQFLKHTLKAKYYVRYADDFSILSNDKQYLLETLRHIVVFLRDELKLEMHPNKVSISTFASGIDFLGWVHFPDHRVLRTATKRRMLRAVSGNPSEGTVASYRGMLGHGNAQKLSKLIPTPISVITRDLHNSARRGKVAGHAYH